MPPYEQFLTKCHELNERIMPASARRIEDIKHLIARTQSQTLQNCYQEVWIHTSAAAKIASHFLYMVTCQFAVSQTQATTGAGLAQRQRIDDMRASLALASLENLVAVVEVSSFRKLNRVLKTLFTQVSGAALPWIDVCIAVKEITDALATPLSEADKVLLELEAYEVAALNAATWAVSQVSAFISPPDEEILALPGEEAARVVAAAARTRVDDTVREVRSQLAEEIDRVLNPRGRQ
jgi:hypothetical protein